MVESVELRAWIEVYPKTEDMVTALATCGCGRFADRMFSRASHLSTCEARNKVEAAMREMIQQSPALRER